MNCLGGCPSSFVALHHVKGVMTNDLLAVNKHTNTAAAGRPPRSPASLSLSLVSQARPPAHWIAQGRCCAQAHPSLASLPAMLDRDSEDKPAAARYPHPVMRPALIPHTYPSYILTPSPLALMHHARRPLAPRPPRLLACLAAPELRGRGWRLCLLGLREGEELLDARVAQLGRVDAEEGGDGHGRVTTERGSQRHEMHLCEWGGSRQ